ncbi:nuclear transport factor 2 family protein [Tenacibaculum geojense]|uniref:Nuclear transport factor 2 family protein n=1 Tax=Tenacibaculum geojense TaxID=915352 RepID=A0ABW3JQ79_9FLAO
MKNRFITLALNNKQMTVREEIIELINKLFIYTDEKKWELLKNEIFADEVFINMESAGGNAEDLAKEAVCELFQSVLNNIDAVYHLVGNHIVTMVNENYAKVFCYATASHYHSKAQNGSVREFVGSYDIEVVKQTEGWKVNTFTYNLKYMNGNLDLA